jgi:hypothetical protein
MKTLTLSLFASLALLTTAATATAITPGTYKGETSQGEPITIKVKRALGPGVRIERLKLEATVECPGGFPDQVTIDRLVIGGKVKKNGRFRLRMADLDLTGRFVGKKRATGSLDVSSFSCSTDNIRFSVRR